MRGENDHTKVTQEIANSLKNDTINLDAHRCSDLQVKCAAIDSINREEVQHVVRSKERAGVNRAMTVWGVQA